MGESYLALKIIGGLFLIFIFAIMVIACKRFVVSVISVNEIEVWDFEEQKRDARKKYEIGRKSGRQEYSKTMNTKGKEKEEEQSYLSERAMREGERSEIVGQLKQQKASESRKVMINVLEQGYEQVVIRPRQAGE